MRGDSERERQAPSLGFGNSMTLLPPTSSLASIQPSNRHAGPSLQCDRGWQLAAPWQLGSLHHHGRHDHEAARVFAAT